jgi:hypothetical protein
MKKMYETERDAFLGGYASVDESGASILKTLLGTETAFNVFFHSKKHAYLAGATGAKVVIASKARAAFVFAKDAGEAVEAAESFVYAAKDAYLAAKRTAKSVAYIASLSANDAAKVVAETKAEWKEAERAVIAARDIACKI